MQVAHGISDWSIASEKMLMSVNCTISGGKLTIVFDLTDSLMWRKREKGRHRVGFAGNEKVTTKKHKNVMLNDSCP